MRWGEKKIDKNGEKKQKKKPLINEAGEMINVETENSSAAHYHQFSIQQLYFIEVRK